MFTRAVLETLDSLVAPKVRESLIRDALALAGLPELPEDARSMRAFASSPLREAAERALGSDLARTLADEILLTIQPGFDSVPPTWRTPSSVALPRPPSLPSFRSTPPPATPRVSEPPTTPRVSQPAEDPPWPAGTGSHIRSSSHAAPDAPTEGMDPRPSGSGSQRPGVEAPFVLIATLDDDFFQSLAEWFSHRARVCRVTTAAALVRHLDGARQHRCLTIFDGKEPSIRPVAFVALLEDQPDTEVVLLRVASALEQVLLASSPITERWLVYRELAPLDHVAAECLRLVS